MNVVQTGMLAGASTLPATATPTVSTSALIPTVSIYV
jgi:hypothetical protein